MKTHRPPAKEPKRKLTRTLKDYRIITGTTDEVQQQMAQAITDGYVPFGSPAFFGSFVDSTSPAKSHAWLIACQSIAKYEMTETKTPETEPE
jgi:hypothetical protein